MKITSLHKNTKIPKYKQVVFAVEAIIEKGSLKKGDQLPSLNKIKDENSLSRDTVLTAFNELKNRGIIHSVVGKGYYVSTENINIKQKIFVLFDELNAFKEDLYNAFLSNLGNDVEVEIYFHHFNNRIFNKLINDNIGDYSSYVIMPANLENTEKVIQNLPKDNVYILDQMHPKLRKYAAIYQNFEKDIFEGLSSILMKISNYKKLVLLFSDEKQPQGILKGFQKFCNQFSINSEVVSSIKDRKIEEGEVYMIPDDKNLIRIIKKIKEKNLILAKNIGIVSINDNLLKEVVEGGITTISTDFNLMGKKLATMILNKEDVKIENPSRLILRKSI